MEAAVAYLETPFRNISGGQSKTTYKARPVFVPNYIQTHDFQKVKRKVYL
jgi:hypothetical protein